MLGNVWRRDRSLVCVNFRLRQFSRVDAILFLFLAPPLTSLYFFFSPYPCLLLCVGFPPTASTTDFSIPHSLDSPTRIPNKNSVQKALFSSFLNLLEYNKRLTLVSFSFFLKNWATPFLCLFSRKFPGHIRILLIFRQYKTILRHSVASGPYFGEFTRRLGTCAHNWWEDLWLLISHQLKSLQVVVGKRDKMDIFVCSTRPDNIFSLRTY